MDLFDLEAKYMDFDMLKSEIVIIGQLLDLNNDQLNLMKAKF